MRTLFTILSALLAYTTAVYATALTYRLEAHEKACFFAHVENKGTKLAFYFAVRVSPGYRMRNCLGTFQIYLVMRQQEELKTFRLTEM
jgi:hypothetical protein